jgi:ribosome production factor 2
MASTTAAAGGGAKAASSADKKRATKATKKAPKTKSKTKTKKARVERYLKSTGPQAREPTKAKLLLKGTRCSQRAFDALRDVRALVSPHARLLARKNPVAAMESDGQRSLEFLCHRNGGASLFLLGSHSKKRPDHLVIGRTFDRQILDVAELALLNFKSMGEHGGGVPKKRIGSKPLLLFVGDAWQHRLDYRNLQNLLTDFYRGDVVDRLVATGLDHVLVFTAAEAAGAGGAGEPSGGGGAGRVLVHQRAYFCKLKRPEGGGGGSSSAPPVPLLVPCGPDLDLSLRRTQWADRDLHNASRRQPGGLKAKKRKNRQTNALGETLGRLHVPRQNVDKRQGKKGKALRRAERAAAQEEAGEAERELDAERDELRREGDRDRAASAAAAAGAAARGAEGPR